LGGRIAPFDLKVGVLDLPKDLAQIEFALDKKLVEATASEIVSEYKLESLSGDKVKVLSKWLEDIRSSTRDALIRSGLQKPDLEPWRFHVSQWDDVILGLDTNLFHRCTCTAHLLDSLLKIPSGDFVDTPDWMTFVVSKVCMAELEHQATRAADTEAWKKRQALRSLQEIMLLNRSKDLEGVSLFVTGNVPAEVDFDRGETCTVRDFLIRDQFRNFLKQLDFYKGSYFVTGDFDNATLAEAEGLTTLYILKPEISAGPYQLAMEVCVSEILYELAVALEPLSIKGDGIKLDLRSWWPGKTFRNWENWELRIRWVEDNMGIQDKFERLRTEGAIADLYLEIKQGSGRVFLDTFPLTKVDTSIRVA